MPVRLLLALLLLILSLFLMLLASEPARADGPALRVAGGPGQVGAWQVPLGRLDATRAFGAQTTVAVIDSRLGPEGDIVLGGRVLTRQDAVRVAFGRRAEATEHALLVAGTLAGTEAGACPSCRVVAIGVMRATRFGPTADPAALVVALRRARRAGARVINMSLGSLTCAPALRREIARTIDKGVIVVAAAGNFAGQRQMLCPARLPGVVSVGALTLSSHALSSTYDGQSLAATVWAQGEWVRAGTGSDGRQLWSTGSSFAAPQVAGAIATLVAQPGWRVRNRAGVRRVIAHLRQSASALADGRRLLDARALIGAGPAEAAAFGDEQGRLLVDTRGAGPHELCAADGEPFQVHAVGALTAGTASAREPDGSRSPAPAGAWRRVGTIELSGEGLYSLLVERPSDQGRQIVVRPAGGCPAP